MSTRWYLARLPSITKPCWEVGMHSRFPNASISKLTMRVGVVHVSLAADYRLIIDKLCRGICIFARYQPEKHEFHHVRP